jgi:hypothetical protein
MLNDFLALSHEFGVGFDPFTHALQDVFVYPGGNSLTALVAATSRPHRATAVGRGGEVADMAAKLDGIKTGIQPLPGWA